MNSLNASLNSNLSADQYNAPSKSTILLDKLSLHHNTSSSKSLYQELTMKDLIKDGGNKENDEPEIKLELNKKSRNGSLQDNSNKSRITN